LLEIYMKYGVFRENLTSFAFEGIKGQETMANRFEELRQKPPTKINGIAVVRIEDYLSHQAIDLKNGKVHHLSLPKSDVLRFWLEDESKIVIRSSGTEPKMKLYCGVRTKKSHLTLREVKESCQELDAKLKAIAQYMKETFFPS